MNFLESLANEARKKRDQLLNRQPQAAPVAPPPRPTQFSPLAQSRILARDPSGGQAKINAGPVIPKPVIAPHQNTLQKIAGGFAEGAPTLGLAAKRVAIGTGQDLSGAYDLLSKGTGTNRVSKFLDKQAVNTDREAQRRHVTASYQQTQAPLALSAFAAPGLGYAGAAAKTAKVASTMPKVTKAVNAVNKATQAVNKTKVVQKAVKPVTQVMSKLDNGNFVQRVTGAAVRGGLHPSSLVNTATGTITDLGGESGKGRDISGRDVATSLIMNAGASATLPAIGRVGQEAVTNVVPAAKAVNKAVKVANTKKGTVANYDAHINDLNRQKSQLQQRIDTSVKTNPNWRGIETTQQHIDQLDGEIARTIANKPKLTLKDKVLAPNVGLSTQPIKKIDGLANHSPEHQSAIDEAKKTFSSDYYTSDTPKKLYRGSNDVNAQQAHPDRPTFYAETPEYAGTYGKVSEHDGSGRMVTIDRENAYGPVAHKVGNVIRSDAEFKALNGPQRDAVEQYMSNLNGENISRLMGQPMPEIVKRAFAHAGIDHIKVEGNQFRGTVGSVGHQSEVIAIPKPTSNTGPAMSIDKPDPIKDTNALLNEFTKLRKQGGNDEAFYNDVILNNVEAQGKIGALSRAIAKRVEGTGEKVSDVLNDELSNIDVAAQKAEAQTSSLTDLKAMTRKLERDTGQKGLYTSVAKAMRGMPEEQQIAYLSEALTKARDSGAMAAAHINKQTGYQPTSKTAPMSIDPESKAHDFYKQGGDQEFLAGLTNKYRDQMNGGRPILEMLTPSERARYDEIMSSAPTATPAAVSPQPEAKPRLPASRETGGVSLPENTTKLNTNRLNTDDASKAVLDKATQATLDHLGNKEVQEYAKKAGIDTRTHTTEQTREIIAKQLNVRQDAVKYLAQAKQATDISEKAALIKKAAERGRTSREQGTDIARQLQARKIIANELDSPEQRIFKLLDNAGVNPDVYSRRLADVDFGDSKQVVAAYRELVPAKAGNWLDLVRYNSMLSSPLTQEVNIFGNAQNLLVGGVEKNLRGNIDAIGGLFGKPRQYARGEGTAYVAGSAKAIGEASQNFVHALKGTGKYANSDLEEYSIPLATKGAAGAAYKTLSVPMRVLDGMDKFFRTLAEAGEESSLVKRENSGIAVKGNRDELKKSEADYRVFQTELGKPGQGIINQAMDEFAGLAMKARNSKSRIVSNIAKFTIPFVKTVNNINKQGLVDYSPLGFVNLKGNADKTTAITRAVMGSAVFGTSAALMAQGQMTWAEPRNADERAQFRADGKQPYSIRIGDKWVNFSKLTPSVSFPMAMTAALHDALEQKKTDQSTVNAVLEAVAKYGNFLSDQSYAKSVGDTLGAAGGDKQAIAQAVSNNVQQVVPFRALSGWIARISDNTERKVNTDKGYIAQQVESLMQQYPGLRQNTTTRDNAGIPIAANNQVFNGFSPVKVTNDRTGQGFNAGGSLASTGLGGGSVKSDDAIKAAFNTPEGRKFIALKDADKKAAAQSDPKSRALYDQYQAMKKGTSTSTELRPEGLSDDSTKTLNRYDRLTTKAKDKVLSREKDAEYKLALAKYESDKLDGNLSTTEDIRRVQELQKAEVGSRYNKEVRDLYGLNKTQLYKHITTVANGKQLADQLIAYGDELEANDLGDNKFRDSKGTIAFNPKKGGSGSNKYGLKPSDFVTPYTNLIKSSTAGASLARSAGLARKKA